MRLRIPIPALALAALLLAGCSGSSGGPATVDTPTPPPNPGPAAPIADNSDAAYGANARAALAQISSPGTMAVDASGNLYMGSHVGVLKLDPAGRRVAAFGTEGWLDVRAQALLTDELSRLYALSDNGVSRFDGSGQRDAAFGDGGEARIDFGIPVALSHLLRDAQGNLYALGNPQGPAEAGAIAIARLDASGRPLPGFGENGRRIVTFPVPLPVQAAALDSRGNLVVAGIATLEVAGVSEQPVFIVRLDPNGERLPIAGFDGVGRASPCNPLLPTDLALAVAPDERVYIGVSCDLNPGGTGLRARIAVARIDVPAIQSGFGDNGVVRDVMGDHIFELHRVHAMLVDESGDLYVAGAYSSEGTLPCSGRFGIAKLDAAGRHVPSFGTGGRAAIGIGAGDTARWIARDAFGRLYLGGDALVSCGILRPGSNRFAAARVAP